MITKIQGGELNYCADNMKFFEEILSKQKRYKSKRKVGIMENKGSQSDRINYDEALLFTSGRGRNTWSVYFFGETDKSVPITFSFRLNISSLPFGFKSIKMYDSVLAVTMANEQYLFERDYGEIKKKTQLQYDNLFFQGNTLKLEGSFDMIDLTVYISNCSVDVAMDFVGANRMIGSINLGDFMLRREKIVHYISAGNMECQGLVTIDGTKLNVKGAAWVEKKYVEFPKGRMKDTHTKLIKINFIPENMERRFTYISVADKLSGEEKSWLTVIEHDGVCFTYETNSDVWDYNETWTSPDTGKKYPLPLNINLPDCMWEASVSTDLDAQEVVYSSDPRDSAGEYIGSGHFKGIYEGTEMKGMCSIEITENSF